MLLDVKIFQLLADFINRDKIRRDREHEEFMEFYRELVETIPAAAAEAFGCMNGVGVAKRIKSGLDERSWGIELTPTDYLWWRRYIDEGFYLTKGCAETQLDILERLAKLVDMSSLTVEERQQLLDLQPKAELPLAMRLTK